MIRAARLLPLAVAVLASVGVRTPLIAQSGDVEAIKRVVRGESEAYFRRDADAWQNSYVHDSTASNVVMWSGGFARTTGWEKFGLPVIEFLKTAKPDSIKFEDVNHRIHVDGALAFAEYDQRYTYPPDTVMRSAHQHRALVKRDGEWKIYMTGVLRTDTYGADSNFVEARLREIGRTLSAARKHRDAIQVLKLNAQMFPKSPRVYKNLADAYEAAGETQFAIQNLKRSAALDPTNKEVKEALAKYTAAKSP